MTLLLYVLLIMPARRNLSRNNNVYTQLFRLYKNQTRKIVVQIEASRLMCDIVSSPAFIIFIGTKESPSIAIVMMS